jgi:hypothetical protein
MITAAERERRAAQAQREHVMRMAKWRRGAVSAGWTIKRAADRDEIQLVKLTSKTVGARESEFWRWVDSKQVASSCATSIGCLYPNDYVKPAVSECASSVDSA